MSTKAVIALTPESVAHVLKGMYRSFQQCGAGATLAGDKFKLTQFAERDTGSPEVTTHIRLTGQGDLSGYRLQITGPAVDAGDNPVRSLEYWFDLNGPAVEAIAHMLSAFGVEMDVPPTIPFLWQPIQLKDVGDKAALRDVRIVVGQMPGTHDLIVYRAETEDRKFRLTTLSRQALEAGPFIPTPDPLASEVMFSFLVQQMGAAAMASMLNENQLAKIWQRVGP